jgi:hypothetical protein
VDAAPDRVSIVTLLLIFIPQFVLFVPDLIFGKY